MKNLAFYFLAALFLFLSISGAYAQIHIDKTALENNISQLKADKLSANLSRESLLAELKYLQSLLKYPDKLKAVELDLIRDQVKKTEKKIAFLEKRESKLLEKIADLDQKLPLNALKNSLSEGKFDLNKYSFLKKLLAKPSFLGGDFGFYWGADSRYLNLSPTWNIQSLPYLTLGAGVLCQYQGKSILTNESDGSQSKTMQESFLYGLKTTVGTNYKGFLAQLQAELLNAAGKNNRYWTSAFWVSAGYQLKLKEDLGVNLMFRYNLAQGVGQSR